MRILVREKKLLKVNFSDEKVGLEMTLIWIK